MPVSGCNGGATAGRAGRMRHTAVTQAARTTEQRRQWRVSNSWRLVSGAWHFWQRASRIMAWWDRHAPVASFSAWRVQPSHTHFPKVGMQAPFVTWPRPFANLAADRLQAMCRWWR
jgi:hypothetical protein